MYGDEKMYAQESCTWTQNCTESTLEMACQWYHGSTDTH